MLLRGQIQDILPILVSEKENKEKRIDVLKERIEALIIEA